MLGSRDKSRRGMCMAALCAALAVLPQSAFAHIKWFAPYDVPAQPRLLSQVFDVLFWEPIVVALGVLLLTCYAERGPIGRAMLDTLELLGRPLRSRIDDLYRAGTAVFFVAIAVLGGIILTPELKTDFTRISWYEIAIALGMFW